MNRKEIFFNVLLRVFNITVYKMTNFLMNINLKQFLMLGEGMVLDVRWGDGAWC